MTYSRVFSRSAIALVIFVIPGAAVQSQTPTTFTLDAAATAAKELSLTVKPETTLSFKVIRGGDSVSAGLAVDVGTFTNAQGASVPVSVSLGSDSDTNATHVEPGAFTRAILAVNLYVKKFPAPGTYTGVLIVSTAGKPESPGLPPTPGTPAQSTTWRINLSSADEVRPATLVIDQNAVTLTGAKAFCVPILRTPCFGLDDKPTVTLHVRDKTGIWPLKGVIAKSESGLKAPGSGFDWKTHMAATFNDASAVDLFSSAANDSRTVDAKDQGTITLTFKDLQPGEYTIPLRFTASNSIDDDQQKLLITLQMRDSLIPGIMVLFLAAAASFFATRVVSMLRQRAAFLSRVRALRPAWLANELPILPVIWLRSTLRLAESLSGRFWLTGQAELDTRLAAAGAMLAVLDRVRQVRGRVQSSIREPTVQQRAIWKLDQIVNRLGAAPLSEQDVAYFKAQLDKFDDWFDSDRTKREAVYWADVLPVIQARYAEAKAASLPADARTLADKLCGLLKTVIDPDPPKSGETAAAPPSLEDKIKAELNYQRLSILLELCRRDHSNLVTQLGGPDAPIETTHKVVDDAWWNLLKEKAQSIQIIKVEGPSGTLDPPEAYETVTFRVVTPTQPFLRDTYLMQKKLKYRWTIKIWKAKYFQNAEELGQLEVVSMQPQIAQYSPEQGEMRASVEIEYAGEKVPRSAESDSVRIAGTTDFKVFSKYEITDFLGFALAAGASIVSGLTLYVLKPTFFGSLQDYLTLFTWGASIDQGKNFLQSLGAYSATTNRPASQGGGGGGG